MRKKKDRQDRKLGSMKRGGEKKEKGKIENKNEKKEE